MMAAKARLSQDILLKVGFIMAHYRGMESAADSVTFKTQGEDTR